MKVLENTNISTFQRKQLQSVVCCDAYGNAREDGGLSSIIWRL